MATARSGAPETVRNCPHAPKKMFSGTVQALPGVLGRLQPPSGRLKAPERCRKRLFGVFGQRRAVSGRA
eukprot:1391291-Alexandrium_andersonii.AAC.1